MATVELELEESALVVAALKDDATLECFVRLKPSEITQAVQDVVGAHTVELIRQLVTHKSLPDARTEVLVGEVADQIYTNRVLGMEQYR